MWKLTPDELRQLLNLLRSAYQSYEELRLLLALDGRNIADASPPARMQDVILAVILKSQADGWLDALVSAVKRDKPNRADVQAFSLSAPAQQRVAGSDPYEDHVVRRNRVLLDREPLRKAIRTLEQTADYRFLVVTGDEKSGKTYSRQFITHIFEQRQTFELGWINLVDFYKQDDGPLTPERIAERLFAYLRIPSEVPRKDDEKYERWSQRACEAIIKGLPPLQPGVPRVAKWVVIDGFNAVPLHDGTIAFIEELSKHVEATLTDLRLILLGWKGTLPEDPEQLTVRETLASITDDHMKDFFWAAHKRRSPGLVDDDLAREVAESIAKVKRSVDPQAAQFTVAVSEAVAREWALLI